MFNLHRVILACAACLLFAGASWADSPELALREFASGQVKKGVRSIGFGGDGATWGNYGLVWKDANTALLDAGDTAYADGNNFRFGAVGITSPTLWHGLAIYAIALQQSTNTIDYQAKSPGLGPTPQPVSGQGENHAEFVKIAMPLGGGVSAGLLLSHELSDFHASSLANPGNTVSYQTQWRPSGGFGVAWQPSPKVLVGFRALLNRDTEHRNDATGDAVGTASSQEFRLGGSYAPWSGALIDTGFTHLRRKNTLSGTDSAYYAPNLGFEQSFPSHGLTARFGLDESSPGVGLTAKFGDFKLDAAFVHDLGRKRVGDLFGHRSDSLIMTLNWDYLSAFRGKPRL
jgi:hypothetical protein